MKRKKEKRKKRIRAPKLQSIFCILSFIFIVGCCAYYGHRLIKYYKIYNPKNESGEILQNLSARIITSEDVVETGEGLYNINGNYVYKGEKVNNYIIISNMLFRIMKINTDKTMDVVLDDYINKMKWDTNVKDYLDSNINEYLNEKFLNIFDKDNLQEVSICTNPISDLSEFDCEDSNSKTYVRLIGVSDYLNSLNNEKTYLNINGDNVWLYTTGDDGVWNTTSKYINSSNPNNLYGVKPVITLKNSTVYLSGDGSLEAPYIISRDKNIKVGTYLDINDDIYIVYEVGEDYLKIESNKVLKDKMVFDNKSNNYSNSSLKTYLEDTYLGKLSYKNLLKEVNFDDYKGKIGILSLKDLKFNSSLNNYYLKDTNDDNVYIYNGSVLTSKVDVKRNIRYALGIKKDLKIISGNGTSSAPFIVEG